MVFANTVNSSFSYTLFHLLYKNHVVFNFQKLHGFGNVVTQFYLNFLNFQKSGRDTSPHTLPRYCFPGSNFVRRLNGKAAREDRKTLMVLAPRKCLMFIHSGTSESAQFQMG